MLLRSKAQTRRLRKFPRRNLTVETVVDAVNYVLSLRRKYDEAGFVFLQGSLLTISQALDAVHITNSLQRGGVGNDLARSTRVEARESKVRPNIGVVKINLVSTTKVLDSIVVAVREGGERRDNGSGRGSSLGEELTASLDTYFNE